MNTQPILTGDLIELRPLHQDDFEKLLTAASDPLIWEMHPQPDRYKREVFKKFFNEAIDSKGAMLISERQSSQVIGTSRFYNFSKIDNSIVIGYTFLSRAFWGGQYNYELKKLMINYALGFVKTVYFHVGLNNIRSQKALEKIGAINTGIEEIPVSYAPPKKSYIYKIERPLK